MRQDMEGSAAGLSNQAGNVACGEATTYGAVKANETDGRLGSPSRANYDVPNHAIVVKWGPK